MNSTKLEAAVQSLAVTWEPLGLKCFHVVLKSGDGGCIGYVYS
jgi:hypothetical protein